MSEKAQVTWVWQGATVTATCAPGARLLDITVTYQTVKRVMDLPEILKALEPSSETMNELRAMQSRGRA